MDFDIIHDTKKHKFYIAIKGQEAHLEYEDKGDGVLDFFHTFVPSVFRGQGIAAKILKFACDYAKENGFKIIATCPYAKNFISQNEDYKNLLLN